MRMGKKTILIGQNGSQVASERFDGNQERRFTLNIETSPCVFHSFLDDSKKIH